MGYAQVSEKSVFVKINEYREIVESMNALKAKLEDAKATLDKINELRKEEETEIELWHNNMNELDKKIGFIESTLLEPGN